MTDLSIRVWAGLGSAIFIALATAIARRRRRARQSTACQFCGHRRIRNFCSRCGRAATLQFVEMPAGLEQKYAIHPFIAPGADRKAPKNDSVRHA